MLGRDQRVSANEHALALRYILSSGRILKGHAVRFYIQELKELGQEQEIATVEGDYDLDSLKNIVAFSIDPLDLEGKGVAAHG